MNVKFCIIFLSAFYMLSPVSAPAQSGPLDPNQTRLLIDALKTASPYASIDITYTSQEIKSPALAKRELQSLQKAMDVLASKVPHKYELRPGSFNSAGQYVIQTDHIVKIDSTRFWHKTTSHMSGDGRQALRDEIRISDGNCLYRIDDHLKVIYRSAYPGYDAVLQVLAFGKIPSSSILRAKLGKNPSAGNFTPADWHINYIRPSQLNGIPVDQIDLVRSQSSQVYSSMFLDHSDWTLCRKIELFNSQSANLSHEKIFEDFSNAKSSGAMYPLKTTIITYDSNGTESSRLIIQVTSVDTQPHFAPDQFTIDRPEYADYKIQEFEGAVNPLKNCPHKK